MSDDGHAATYAAVQPRSEDQVEPLDCDFSHPSSYRLRTRLNGLGSSGQMPCRSPPRTFDGKSRKPYKAGQQGVGQSRGLTACRIKTIAAAASDLPTGSGQPEVALVREKVRIDEIDLFA